jgi:hypothetical protein
MFNLGQLNIYIWVKVCQAAKHSLHGTWSIAIAVATAGFTAGVKLCGRHY